MPLKHAVLCILLFANASLAGETQNWEFKHKPITGEYGIYGGELGDPVAPGKDHKKITFSIRGKMAQEMFDAMGPDVKDVCTEGTGDRARKKDNENLSCIRTKKGEYFCNFGFDLRTGKSIGGVVC
jgi:hypothetical protein